MQYRSWFHLNSEMTDALALNGLNTKTYSIQEFIIIPDLMS